MSTTTHKTLPLATRVAKEIAEELRRDGEIDEQWMADWIEQEAIAPFLEAIERVDELYSTLYPNPKYPEVSHFGLIPNVDGVGKMIGMVRDAIRLAKGESQ